LGEGEALRDQVLLEHARRMRGELTEPERRLWLALRAKRLDGAKFRRQVVIGRYIADFACRSPVKLVVEVDGDTHSEREAYDCARTVFLETQGYQVLRFGNDDVMTNLDGVLLTIQSALLTPPLPGPLP
jgi:very-short-patch-repair endonuclease